MKKISASALIALTMLCSLNAQLKSPEEFLGYKIGSRYTPHWKIVNYFNHVAANAATTVKLDKYGETNEGRPLLISFISSAENIQQLEAIRLNNLRLANRAKDKMGVNENAPAIVWLSYNVHGNETSSSEAAMLTLYALANPANTETKEWLKNIVVIIDPCINPDGRDRYVNWFNSIAGKTANPRLDAREHREPWPGGRTNHYNFDLNRDWAWQTQVETQQRIKVYEQWLPQIHVDYHEQGVNEPYYFAPAAQPYHEVITKWQRDFQTAIGKNNAKYFDKNNWLFFTKEVFDLLYPSYGDTYPIYNGAIGMTYEQGGGPGGGLAAQTDDNDTLTLHDRAMHHYTTSLSTIEIASLNAGKLIREFRNFFNEAVTTGIGEYKTYVIKDEQGNGQRMQAFKKTLEKNNIQYGTATASGRGYNYQTGKEENFSIAPGDVVVSALQPKSALVKVLLEPVSKLVDSVTYDITAWSLPYAYGLKAYAAKEKINPAALDAAKLVNEAKEVYGYIIKWEGVNSVKAAGQLMQKGILLRCAEQPFETGGQKFGRGSLIILKTSNKSQAADLWKTVADVCNENNITAYPVASGFVDKGYDFGSDKVRPLKAPKVALVTGEGVGSNAAGEIWHFFERQLDYPLTLINANDLAKARWDDIDVLIMPDGNYKFLNEKAQLDEFKNWITKGGRVVALEGAVAQLAKAEMGIKLKKAAEEDDDKKDKKDSDEGYDALKKFENRERDFIPNYTPGSIFKVDMDNTHPLAYGYPNFYYTLKMDDNIYEFIKGGGWNVGVIKKENQIAGFVGAKLKSKLKDGLLFGVQDMGRGAISYLADNVMFRSFWENGKLMFCNAVFLVGQ
jgi:Zinc carboxypeptidase